MSLIEFSPRNRDHNATQHYAIGGGWGNAINWLSQEQFDKPCTDETLYNVYGFKGRRPVVGDLLFSEHEQSDMIFLFVEVEHKRDPRDMFFAKVKPVSQRMLADGQIKSITHPLLKQDELHKMWQAHPARATSNR
jgi:hypothetical protein